MKVEIKEQPQQIERKYPYVGKSFETGTVILFIKPYTGIVLHHHCEKIGHFSSTIFEQNFIPLPPNSVTITI